jgi:hypothetical protein
MEITCYVNVLPLVTRLSPREGVSVAFLLLTLSLIDSTTYSLSESLMVNMKNLLDRFMLTVLIY